MIDFLFLDRDTCYWCKSEKITKFYLCENCLSKLDYVDNKFEIDGYQTHAIYFYNKFIANMVSNYKFNRNTSLFRVFGSMVENYIEESNRIFLDYDYLLPVPSSKKTLNNRGFDHIKLISNYFIKKYNMNYLNSFEKMKDTKSQHTLNLEDRMYNLNGAFYCKKNLEKKSVLIFDDIITSGNTVREIIKELKKNEVGDIKILCLTSSHRVI